MPEDYKPRFQAQLLVEGVDRVGKSTMIATWRKMFPGYFHDKAKVLRTLNESMDYYTWFMRDMLARHNSFIWDRSFVSEMVYTPLYKDYTNSYWPSALENTKWQDYPVQPIIVYVYPRNEHIMLADERPNAKRNAELDKYDEVLNLFRHEGNIPVIDISTQDIDDWRTPEAVCGELMIKVVAMLGTMNYRG